MPAALAELRFRPGMRLGMRTPFAAILRPPERKTAALAGAAVNLEHFTKDRESMAPEIYQNTSPSVTPCGNASAAMNAAADAEAAPMLDTWAPEPLDGSLERYVRAHLISRYGIRPVRASLVAAHAGIGRSR